MDKKFSTNSILKSTLLTSAWPWNQHMKRYQPTVGACNPGGVYVPCIYMHARWVTVGDSGLCCTCAMYFRRWLTPLFVDFEILTCERERERGLCDLSACGVCGLCVWFVCVCVCARVHVCIVIWEECLHSNVVFWFVIRTPCIPCRTARLGALSHYHYQYCNFACDFHEQHFTHMWPSRLTEHYTSGINHPYHYVLTESCQFSLHRHHFSCS